MSKKRDPIDALFFNTKRPNCTFPGCKNKARRIGKRQYGQTCDKHKPIYGAA